MQNFYPKDPVVRWGNWYPYFIACFVLPWILFALPMAASETIELILAWDANIEENIDGYEIYYRTAGSDYKFIGDVYVDELADPDNPMVSITDFYNGAPADASVPVVAMPALAMTDGRPYYFALTAFDVQGNKSDFSEEIFLEASGSTVVECSSFIDDDAASAKNVSENDTSQNSQSARGCFISTTSL